MNTTPYERAAKTQAATPAGQRIAGPPHGGLIFLWIAWINDRCSTFRWEQRITIASISIGCVLRLLAEPGGRLLLLMAAASIQTTCQSRQTIS